MSRYAARDVLRQLARMALETAPFDSERFKEVVTALKKQASKKSGAEFARLTVEDFSGSSEVLVFPEAWANLCHQIRVDVPILLKGGYSKLSKYWIC